MIRTFEQAYHFVLKEKVCTIFGSMEESGCTKSRFDTALKKLQITLNIARSNHPDDKRDRWVPFSEMYPEIAETLESK